MFEVIDERVSFETLITEYLLRPESRLEPDVWVRSCDLAPEMLEPASRRAIFGGDDAHRFGFDVDGNRL